jgi:hypothetical protein
VIFAALAISIQSLPSGTNIHVVQDEGWESWSGIEEGRRAVLFTVEELVVGFGEGRGMWRIAVAFGERRVRAKAVLLFEFEVATSDGVAGASVGDCCEDPFAGIVTVTIVVRVAVVMDVGC